MARVTQAQLQHLNAQSSVERLVRELGTALRQDGDVLLGRCPFRDECGESLVIDPGSNRWRCRSCGASGGPIAWLVRRKGISLHHAVELLRSGRCAAAGHEATAGPTGSGASELDCPVQAQAGEQELLDQVFQYYHQTLLASPEALTFLERRGIGSRELIDAHRLGFANRTLGLRLPPARVKAGAALRGRLQKLGLLRPSGHEHFNGCLVVPTIDAAGHVVTAYGRKITENVNPPLHLYLPRVQRGAWNAAALSGQTEAILTWGLIDAMTFWCAGWRNVTTAHGPEGLVDEHLEALQRFGVRRVFIAFGRDEAGERAAGQATERLLALGLECLRLPLPRGMDVNEFARRQRPADKSLGLLMRKAVWVGKGTPTLPPSASVSVAEAPASDSGPTGQAAIAPVACTTSPALDPDVQTGADEVVVNFEERRYRVRGLARNLSAQTLKVNILVSRGETYFVDSFDLYSARSPPTSSLRRPGNWRLARRRSRRTSEGCCSSSRRSRPNGSGRRCRSSPKPRR